MKYWFSLSLSSFCGSFCRRTFALLAAKASSAEIISIAARQMVKMFFILQFSDGEVFGLFPLEVLKVNFNVAHIRLKVA